MGSCTSILVHVTEIRGVKADLAGNEELPFKTKNQGHTVKKKVQLSCRECLDRLLEINRNMTGKERTGQDVFFLYQHRDLRISPSVKRGCHTFTNMQQMWFTKVM